MANIDRLDKEAKEYFYSLPLNVQQMVVNSNKEVTCREDIQRYFSNAVVATKNQFYNSNKNAIQSEANAPTSNSNLFWY